MTTTMMNATDEELDQARLALRRLPSRARGVFERVAAEVGLDTEDLVVALRRRVGPPATESTADQTVHAAVGRTLARYAKRFVAKGDAASFEAGWDLAMKTYPLLAEMYRPTLAALIARYEDQVPGVRAARDVGALASLVAGHYAQEHPEVDPQTALHQVLDDNPALKEAYARS